MRIHSANFMLTASISKDKHGKNMGEYFHRPKISCERLICDGTRTFILSTVIPTLAI